MFSIRRTATKASLIQLNEFKLTNDKPVFCKAYRYPEIRREELDKQNNEMLTQSIISKCHSPYQSPI